MEESLEDRFRIKAVLRKNHEVREELLEDLGGLLDALSGLGEVLSRLMAVLS